MRVKADKGNLLLKLQKGIHKETSVPLDDFAEESVSDTLSSFTDNEDSTQHEEFSVEDTAESEQLDIEEAPDMFESEVDEPTSDLLNLEEDNTKQEYINSLLDNLDSDDEVELPPLVLVDDTQSEGVSESVDGSFDGQEEQYSFPDDSDDDSSEEDTVENDDSDNEESEDEQDNEYGFPDEEEEDDESGEDEDEEYGFPDDDDEEEESDEEEDDFNFPDDDDEEEESDEEEDSENEDDFAFPDDEEEEESDNSEDSIQPTPTPSLPQQSIISDSRPDTTNKGVVNEGGSVSNGVKISVEKEETAKVENTSRGNHSVSTSSVSLPEKESIQTRQQEVVSEEKSALSSESEDTSELNSLLDVLNPEKQVNSDTKSSSNIKHHKGMRLDDFLRENPTVRSQKDVLDYYIKEDIDSAIKYGLVQYNSKKKKFFL